MLVAAGGLLLTACSGVAESGAGPAVTPGTAAVRSEVTETTGPSTPSPEPDGLLARLRSGGMIVVIRHAATDQFIPDRAEDLDDCATQRNLTAEGRADAATIGDAFRTLRIPVGAVLTSPFCRTRDTAELAFGNAEVVDDLARLFPQSDQRADRRLSRLVRERAPDAGDANLVLVAHSRYPSILTPATLGEGEAAVYAVAGSDFILVGQVAPNEWADLAAQ